MKDAIPGMVDVVFVTKWRANHKTEKELVMNIRSNEKEIAALVNEFKKSTIQNIRIDRCRKSTEANQTESRAIEQS